MRFLRALRFKSQAAPGNPPAGHVDVYAKADGKVYAKDSGGTEYDLTSGGSGGLPALGALSTLLTPDTAGSAAEWADFKLRRPCRVATTANVTLSGTQTVNGVALVAGDRVLVRAQTTQSENGVYVVASGAWTRAADADSVAELVGAVVPVTARGGTTMYGLFFSTFPDTGTVGSTAFQWNQAPVGAVVPGYFDGSSSGFNGPFPHGVSWAWVAVSSSWPNNGLLVTFWNDTGDSVQWLYPVTTNSLSGNPQHGFGVFTRHWVTSFGQWSPWLAIDNWYEVRVATTGNITLSGTQTIDGVSLAVGDRVLVKDQTTASADGIYNVASGAWTRATDAQYAGQFTRGRRVNVTAGTAHAGKQFSYTAVTAPTIGTTALTFVAPLYVESDIPSTITRDSEAVLQASAGGKGATPVATAAGAVTFEAAGADGTVHVFDSTQATGRKAIVNDDLIPFNDSGTLIVKTGKSRFRMPFAGVLLGVAASVNTAPTGNSLIVDLNKNGTTVFTTQGNRPVIAAGSNSSSETSPDASPAVFAAGDYLTVDVDQVGSVVAGSDLVVVVRYRKS